MALQVSNSKTVSERFKRVTATGTWTVPANVYVVYVSLWGAGGGGSGGAAATYYGGGGGAGYYAVNVPVGVTPAENITVTLGTGGTGGAVAGAGGAGGNTSFGTYLSVKGGEGGRAAVGTNGAGGMGGAGGAATGSPLVTTGNTPNFPAVTLSNIATTVAGAVVDNEYKTILAGGNATALANTGVLGGTQGIWQAGAGGAGGGSYVGSGGNGGLGTGNAGTAGTAGNGGGGGGINAAGGAGGEGVCIIKWYE
jgi:hypothetical protein